MYEWSQTKIYPRLELPTPFSVAQHITTEPLTLHMVIWWKTLYLCENCESFGFFLSVIGSKHLYYSLFIQLVSDEVVAQWKDGDPIGKGLSVQALVMVFFFISSCLYFFIWSFKVCLIIWDKSSLDHKLSFFCKCVSNAYLIFSQMQFWPTIFFICASFINLIFSQCKFDSNTFYICASYTNLPIFSPM